MDFKELLEYIKKRNYCCAFCNNLKRKVIEKGVTEIETYEGMICGGVEDMMNRFDDAKMVELSKYS